MSERDNFGSFFIGFLSGAIVGAVATILYAPTSGEETRAAINNKKDEWIDKANVGVDDAYKHVESTAREARSKFEDFAASTRERAEDATRKGHVILEKRINGLKKKTDGEIAEDIDEILMPVEEAPKEEKTEE